MDRRGFSDGRQGAPPMPRWVKGFIVAAIVVFLTVVALHLTGNGFNHHGLYR